MKLTHLLHVSATVGFKTYGNIAASIDYAEGSLHDKWKMCD